MIENVYMAGYVTREKERDYDPMCNHVVCDAIEKWDRFERLAKSIAGGNFNQSSVIKEAKSLIS